VRTDRHRSPVAFLVSTPGGRAADEVLDALTPALSRLGTWRYVAEPESSLCHAVARAEEEGLAPVHLAIGVAHRCYLTPAVPTLFLPIWDYPDVPATDLNRDGRMNWARVAGRADGLLATSRFTADAFARAGAIAPASILPIPARPGWSELATWGPDLPITVHVPHVVWGAGDDGPPPGAVAGAVAAAEARPSASGRSSSLSARLTRSGARRLRRIKPYLSNASIARIDGYRRSLGTLLRRPDPRRVLGGVARFGYRHLIRRWIGEAAHRRLDEIRVRIRGRRSASEHRPTPCLGPSPLTLSGLVYTAWVDYTEAMTNEVDLISAAIHAFRDRPDVTLLLRLATWPEREAQDLVRLRHAFEASRIEPRCRIVVIPGRLPREVSLAIGRATSYHVETSRTRGLSMATTEALASGRPVIAPAHSAFLEWVDDEVGFPVASHSEPTGWPIDPVGRHATTWGRPAWSHLRDRLIESATIAESDPRRYEGLSAAARQRMAETANVDRAVAALRGALAGLPARPIGSLTWA